MHMELFGLFGNYIVKYLTFMMVYDDLVESLIKRMQLFYVIKVELRIANICWCMWNVDVHTTFI
jgi:hypothetical protein